MTTGAPQPVNGRVDAVSPSLLGPTAQAASYEVKFLVRPLQAEQVRAWARQHLAVDPHADGTLGDAYRIQSVYFDTDTLDVFHQAPSYKRRKFRLRRYGSEVGVYVERKTKSGDRVSKRRTLIGPEEIHRLREPIADPAWHAGWFHRRLLSRRLRPRCTVAYERIAYVGTAADGPIRLTIDRQIQCALTDNFEVTSAAGVPLLDESLILELKFRAAMPPLFKSLIAELNLNPGCISKYRLGIAAWGLAGSAKEVG